VYFIVHVTSFVVISSQAIKIFVTDQTLKNDVYVGYEIMWKIFKPKESQY